MTEISDKIIKDIKEKNIHPKPRWFFAVRNLAFWLLFIAAIFVGALSFAVILDVLTNHDWDIYLRMHKTFGQYILLSLPYLWIVCLIFFAWIAYYDFVHIKGWYRHSVYLIVSISILGSLFLGGLLFYSGVGKKIDHALDARVPFYGMMNINKRKIWCQPKEGLLGGEIMPPPLEAPERVIIKDCLGREWNIERPNMKPFLMRVGDRIKIIGHEMDEMHFEAEEFRRW